MYGSLPVPVTLKDVHTTSGHEVSCDWNRHHFMLRLLVVFWFAFAGFVWFWVASIPPGRSLSEWAAAEEGTFLALMLGPAMLGLCTTYALLAWSLNRIWILINSTGLIVRIGPLPRTGNQTVRRADIIQLFVKEKTKKDPYGKIVRSHEVHLIDSHNRHRVMISRRLEELLGIEEQRVGDAYIG
jgi:hypothetical protein